MCGSKKYPVRYERVDGDDSGEFLTLDSFLRGMPARFQSVWLQRFWARVDKGNAADSCWLWRGATTTNDYGILSVNRQLIRAHRLSFFIANGVLPKDKYVIHRCDEPRCVNPAHLSLGTAADNVADMVAKNRNSTGRKLTEDQVRAIRRRYADGQSTRTLALLYRVKQSTIWNVVTRRTWRHLDETAISAAA